LLTVLGLGTSSMQAQQKRQFFTSLNLQQIAPGFDCSKIREFGLDKMENLRAGAIMIACGEAEGGSPSFGGAFSQLMQTLLPAPLAFGGPDVDLISPQTDAGTQITQSETFTTANPDNPDQIVVAYNDSRAFPSFNNISGASVSTDGGVTFTRLTTAAGRSPFENTFGDPVILYNKPTQTWFTVSRDGVAGCGGVGGYKSTTPWDPNSWGTHFCVDASGGDDRESGYVDNDPLSPFAGGVYVSFKTFVD